MLIKVNTNVNVGSISTGVLLDLATQKHVKSAKNSL